jgi:hypothetical protein
MPEIGIDVTSYNDLLSGSLILLEVKISMLLLSFSLAANIFLFKK